MDIPWLKSAVAGTNQPHLAIRKDKLNPVDQYDLKTEKNNILCENKCENLNFETLNHETAYIKEKWTNLIFISNEVRLFRRSYFIQSFYTKKYLSLFLLLCYFYDQRVDLLLRIGNINELE